jgi:DNA-binding response OmpR family regulator
MIAERIVLVVDDEEHVRETFSKTFQGKKGFKLLKASNANEAFDMILDDFVDVVITDLRMADGGGEELLRMINDIPNVDRPIVYLMTSSYEVDKEEFNEFGVRRFFYKPLNPSEIYQNIDYDLKKIAA